MGKKKTGSEIRQSFIQFFLDHGHTFVRSSSLVPPPGDKTLLFTNAGMVQFKDVFLGTDKRSYRRAVNSQKCMRVAGKHNDLDDVGRDDTHHTFFEMLGNWSFGDYYKKEAISWAWELLVNQWGLDKERLWPTCFKDEFNEIATDEEAYRIWKSQPGINPDHIVFSGRKDNFWEMADTGPCGPCSEIHYDLGPERCNMKDVPGHVCRVNGDCTRYVELWNLVFIQYNRTGPDHLEPLPERHVDTGMGFDRIVSILQDVDSNYKTDLFTPIIQAIQGLANQTDDEVNEYYTPYRVIADHIRAACFLIADGVIPGNTGRNYICRMIVRRASLFGSKIGLNEPFLYKLVKNVADTYGDAYPEVATQQSIIEEQIHQEENRFKNTVEAGLSHLNLLVEELADNDKKILSGEAAFDLYATHGLPLEIVRDILREKEYQVDEAGFRNAMEEHRIISGAGKALGKMGGEKADIYREIFQSLREQGKVDEEGVIYNPYGPLCVEGQIYAMMKDDEPVLSAAVGDKVEVVIPVSPFYIEAGGQVSDTGTLVSLDEPAWKIVVEDTYQPAAGMIVLGGYVSSGTPKVGDPLNAVVDEKRRKDIMRNHTATHLLHAELRRVLGEHARQAGSLVAPDYLRFDFTHPEPLSEEQLEEVERGVNQAILADYALDIKVKPVDEALREGATALFGEKYGDQVRTISIGNEQRISYELCGGTHLDETGDVGLFLITSESSIAAGIRRIEAVTGEYAYDQVQRRFRSLKRSARLLNSPIEELPQKTELVLNELDTSHKELSYVKQKLANLQFDQSLSDVPVVSGIPVMAEILNDADANILRQMTDQFRQHFSSGVVVLGTIFENRPLIVASVTDDLVKRGLHAGKLVGEIARVVGGGGGGKATMAQAGGKDASKLNEAMQKVAPYVKSNLTS
jgi:alanyl-tRNA synthetase